MHELEVYHVSFQINCDGVVSQFPGRWLVVGGGGGSWDLPDPRADLWESCGQMFSGNTVIKLLR
jgi:hypothetical protein